MTLGKPRGKTQVRPVYIGRGTDVAFWIGRPDGKGFGWRFRLPGHRNWEGANGQSFRRAKDAMIAGGDAWLRLGIYQ